MDYVNKFKKEPRLIISVLNVLFFFLPWVSLKISFFGMSESDSVNAFDLFDASFLMVVLFLIALCMVVLPFIPAIAKFTKVIYTGLPIIAILFTFIFTSYATREASGIGIDKSYSIGFWLSVLAYLAIVVFTFIIDYKVSGQSFKDKGVKGVFSDVASQLSSSVSEASAGLPNAKASGNIVCPACNSSAPKGTKFCPKCGGKFPEAAHCTGCGAELPAGTGFCPICGTKAQ